jgi:hypothetical protein
MFGRGIIISKPIVSGTALTRMVLTKKSLPLKHTEIHGRKMLSLIGYFCVIPCASVAKQGS